MKSKLLCIAGLIVGICGVMVSSTAVVLSAIGLAKAKRAARQGW